MHKPRGAYRFHGAFCYLARMDPRKLFADERLSGSCVHCGEAPDTRDHVPSLVLLDEPYPDNLPVVDSCNRCNNGFSDDEPYLACLIECALCGSVDPETVTRPRIKKVLTARPAYGALIASGRTEDSSGNLVWQADTERVRNVVLKLARGHMAYDNSEPRIEDPERVMFAPMPLLTDEQLQAFETAPVITAWPELGSRAFMRAVLGASQVYMQDGWQVIQPGRYRYMVLSDSVRLVLSEYLACEVVW